MSNPANNPKLVPSDGLPLHFNYRTAFTRNRGLVTDREQKVLRHATIAIAGMGGVGGIHLATLARMGIGGFSIADPDVFELQNINRQYGATVHSIGKNKAAVCSELALAINPDVRIQILEKAIDESNIEVFLKDADLVVDGLDAFALPARLLLYRTACRLKLPVICAGPIGFSCAMLVFMPGGKSFEDWIDYRPEEPSEIAFLRFMIALTPRPHFLKYMNTGNVSTANQNGPSIASATALCAGFAGVEALKILLKKGTIYSVPYYHYYDPMVSRFILRRLWFGNRSPIQRGILAYTQWRLHRGR